MKETNGQEWGLIFGLMDTRTVINLSKCYVGLALEWAGPRMFDFFGSPAAKLERRD